MSDTFLDRIAAATRADLAERKASLPLDELRARISDAPPPRSFAEALRPTRAGSARLIAEVKRASPSKGVIAADFDPVRRALAYERGGAAAISVLTEPHFFQGSLEHLEAARRAVGLPVLRKDFILDPYQICEARAAGADAVLLICALLDDATLTGLLALARHLGMEALVEAHDAAEAERAVAAGAAIVGVNSRDLRTFAMDTDVVRHLRPLVPADRVFVAESGIAEDVGAARARAWGADAILVGEALMRADDPEAQAHALATAAGGSTLELFDPIENSFVKICGLTLPEHGFLVGRLQAHAFGLVFAASRRQVDRARAREIVDAAKMGTAFDVGERALASEEPLDTRETLDLIRPPLAVGVFVNEPAGSIAAISGYVGLGALQLSGDETPGECSDIAERTGLPIIKAVRLRTVDDLAQLDAYAQAGATLLIDTPAADGAYGGTGQTGNWQLARLAAQRWPIVLSGGLTSTNLAEAIATVNPAGVDVSSGVETDKAKDLEKISAFINAARTARVARTATNSETSP